MPSLQDNDFISGDSEDIPRGHALVVEGDEKLAVLGHLNVPLAILWTLTKRQIDLPDFADTVVRSRVESLVQMECGFAVLAPRSKRFR